MCLIEKDIMKDINRNLEHLYKYSSLPFQNQNQATIMILNFWTDWSRQTVQVKELYGI